MDPQQTTPQVPNGSMPQTDDKSIGPVVGIIVIIALIVLGGLYFWSQRIEVRNEMEAQNVEQSSDSNVQPSEEFGEQGSSDDVSSIEADLNATDVSSLGNEMDSIENE